jgi:hypothetical protein
MSMTVQEPNRAGRAGSRGEAEERTDLVERTAPGAHRALRHPDHAYLDETQIVSPPRVAAGERGGSAVRCCAARSRPRRGVDRQVVRSKASAPAGVWALLGGVAGFVLAAIVNGIADPDPVSAYKKRHAVPCRPWRSARTTPGLDLVPARRGRRGVAGLEARAHRSRPVSLGRRCGPRCARPATWSSAGSTSTRTRRPERPRPSCTRPARRSRRPAPTSTTWRATPRDPQARPRTGTPG